MKIFLLIAIALGSLSAAAGPPMELKRIRPGMTITQIAQKIPRFRELCHSSGPMKDACAYALVAPLIPGQPKVEVFESFAGLRPNRWTIFTQDDVVETVVIGMQAEHYDDVVAALTEKYGKPGVAGGGRAAWFSGADSIYVRKQGQDQLDGLIVQLVSEPKPKSGMAKKGAMDL